MCNTPTAMLICVKNKLTDRLGKCKDAIIPSFTFIKNNSFSQIVLMVV